MTEKKSTAENLKRRAVVVLGMHRSGTSAVTGLLRLSGAWLGESGELTEANAENPTGFWERRDLRAVCDELLFSAGADWWKVAAFESNAIPHAAASTALDRFREIVKSLEGHGTWAIKEPRLSLLLPVLRGQIPEAAYVHAYRHPIEVARSLRARNGFGLAEGLALWEVYNLAALTGSMDLPRILIDYGDLIERPLETLTDLLRRLEHHGVTGLSTPDAATVKRFVSKRLYRERASDVELERILTPDQRTLWSRLRSGAALEMRPPTICSEVARWHLRDLESRVLSLKRVGDSLRERDDRLKHLDAALEAERDRSKGLQHALEKHSQERQELASELEAEHSRTQRAQAELEAEHSRTQRAQAELKAEHSRTQRAQAELETERAKASRLRDELEEKGNDVAEWKRKLHAEELQSAELFNRVASQERVIRTLRTSKSWRATAPLRAAARGLRASRGTVGRVLHLAGWVLSHQVSRAARAVQPHYRRYVPRRLRELVPVRLRRALVAAAPRGARRAYGVEKGFDRGDHPISSKPNHRRRGPLGGRGSVTPGRATVAVIAWDVSHNPLGRAYLIAEALSRHFNVTLLGPAFPRFGGGVWEPVESAGIPVVPLPGKDLPELLAMYDRVTSSLTVDAVVTCKPRLPSLLLGHLLKRHRNRPLFIDIDDHELAFTDAGTPLALEALAEAPLSELRSPHSETWTRFSQNYIDGVDGCFVSNETLQAIYGGVIVPHARDEDLFDPGRYDRRQLRGALGYQDADRVVLFAGTPRAHKGLLTVLSAVKESSNPRTHLLVVGSAPDAALESELRTRGGDRLTLLRNCSLQDLPRYVACANAVCLLQDPTSPVARYQVPAKLTESLAFGLPVLATDVPPLRPLIDAGVILETSPESLSSDLDRLLREDAVGNSESLRRRRYFLDNLSYEVVGRRMASAITKSLRDRPPVAPTPTTQKLVSLVSSRLQPAPRPRESPADDTGFDLVFVWKQHDLCLYGRRPDMLIKYLSARPEVRRILVLEPPLSHEELYEWSSYDVAHQKRSLYVEWLRKSWGIYDTEKIRRHIHLYSSRASTGRPGIHDTISRGDYERSIQEFFSTENVDPSQATFIVYPRNDYIPDLLRHLHPARVIADIVDDHRTWPTVSPSAHREITDHYRTVLDASEFAIANCEPVREAMSALHADVRLLPNAIDLGIDESHPLSRRFHAFDSLATPRIGYVGNLEKKLDTELVHSVARRHPDWQIVLIGSTHANPEVRALGDQPNVHLPGVVPYEEAKHWIRRFDVAIIPHKQMPMTRHMSPLKLYLYAALGVPVVSTDIDNLGELADHIYVESTPNDFARAIEAALKEHGRPPSPELETVIRRNTWGQRVEKLIEWIQHIDKPVRPSEGRLSRISRSRTRARPSPPFNESATSVPDQYDGLCSVCGQLGTFEREQRSIRESYQCPNCRASLRYRGQADAILDYYGPPGTRSIAELVTDETFRSLAIYEPGVSGPFRTYLSQLAGYRQSIYRDDDTSDESRNDVDHQDLMALTYSPSSFDLVVTSDIFEHVRKPYAAFKEVHRVLRPGGRHIFSIPVTAPMRERTFSRVDTAGPKDVHLVAPRYHGNGRGGRALVYTDFGADLVIELDRLGLPTKVLTLDSPHAGLRSLLTFVSYKSILKNQNGTVHTAP